MARSLSQDWERCQFAFLLNKTRCSTGSFGWTAVGRARNVPYCAGHSHSAAPSAWVGKRFSTVRCSGIDRLRSQMADSRWRIAEAGCCGGARVGRPRWLRILTITGGSSIPAMIFFKAPPPFGQCSMSMSKTRLSSRAQLMRGDALCA